MIEHPVVNGYPMTRYDASTYDTSRRTLLRTAGAVGAAGLTATAGCLGDDDDDDDGNGEADLDEVPDEFVEANPAGDPVEELAYENLDADFPVRFFYGERHANILRDIGFDVEYNVRALQAHLDRTFTDRDHDMMNLRWLDGFDPDRPVRDGAGRVNLAPGGGNTSNHWNPEYEDLLNEQAAAADEDERQELIYQCQEYLVEEETVLVPILVQQRSMPYVNDRVSNVRSFLEDGLAGITNMVNVETPDDELFTIQQEDLTTLDPMSAQRGRADRDHVRLMFDRLAHPDPDEGYLPQPWAAESIETPDDTTVEVTLREGLEFHDGEPVTAEDIEFTYTYGAEQNAGLDGLLTNLENIVVESELEVTFELSQPDAVFLTRGLGGRDSGILPKHILEGVDDPDGWDRDDDIPFVGSGPFQFESWDIGEELVLTAHDDHQFRPNIDRLVRVQAADAAASAAAVEDQTVDMVTYDLPPDQLSRIEQLDHIELLDSVMTSIHYGVMNMDPDRDGPFKYREAREAVAHTYDRSEWLDVAADGFGELLNTTMSSGLGFWRAPEDRVSPPPFDPSAAIQALGEAGFRWDEDGEIHYPEDTDALTTQPDAFNWEGADDPPDRFSDWV